MIRKQFTNANYNDNDYIVLFLQKLQLVPETFGICFLVTGSSNTINNDIS